MTETKREKFHRISELRGRNAVEAISRLQHLARTADYESTLGERADLIDRLDAAVDDAAKALGVPMSTAADAADAAAKQDDLPATVPTGPVASFDKMAIKSAYVEIAKGDRVEGLKMLRRVILGWAE